MKHDKKCTQDILIKFMIYNQQICPRDEFNDLFHDFKLPPENWVICSVALKVTRRKLLEYTIWYFSYVIFYHF